MSKKLPQSITDIVDATRRIPVESIRESVVTLRANYDDPSLDELGDSMENKGQLQTIVVQPAPEQAGMFDLVIGSRRLRSAKRKKFGDIAAYVIEPRSRIELIFIALAENIHRVDLDPFEEAQGFLLLMKEHELDMKEIAKGIDKPEIYVRNRIQLLSMPEDVVTLVSEKKLGVMHVPPLAKLPTGEDQTRFAQMAVRNQLTAPELRGEIRRELETPQRTEHASHELTPLKVQARVNDFTDWLQKVHRRLHLRRMNSADKTGVLKAIQALEDEVRSMRATISGSEITVGSSLSDRTRNYNDPSNHGEEWTTKDIRRIHSPRRPPEHELAIELGRTEGAIRAMRAQTTDKAKSNA